MLYLLQILLESRNCLPDFLQLFLFLLINYSVIFHGRDLTGLLKAVNILDHGLQLHLYVRIHNDTPYNIRQKLLKYLLLFLAALIIFSSALFRYELPLSLGCDLSHFTASLNESNSFTTVLPCSLTTFLI